MAHTLKAAPLHKQKHVHQVLLAQALDFLNGPHSPLAAADLIYRAFLAGSQKAYNALFKKIYVPLQPNNLKTSSHPIETKNPEAVRPQPMDDDSHTLFRKGLCYLLGIAPFEQNDQQALELLEQAAKKNHTDAQHVLGEALKSKRFGKDITLSERNRLAVEYLFSAANHEKPHAGARCSLGEMRRANKIPTDHKAYNTTAETYFEQAKDQRHPMAWFYLGQLKRLAGEAPAAKALFEEAERQGIPHANTELGLIYFHSGSNASEDEKTENDRKAFDYFEKAALEDVSYAQAMLGQMYEDGRAGNSGAPLYAQNLEARSWYVESANQDDPLGLFFLGRNILEGLKIEDEMIKNIPFADVGRQPYEDTEKALSYYQRSAEKGYIKAQTTLAKIYQQGCYDPRLTPDANNKNACYWYHKAANQTNDEYADLIENAKAELKKMHAKGHAIKFIKEQKSQLKTASEEILIQKLTAIHQPFPELNLAVAIKFLTSLRDRNALEDQPFTQFFFDFLKKKPNANDALIQFAQEEAKRIAHDLAQKAESNEAAADNQSATLPSALQLGTLFYPKRHPNAADSDETDDETAEAASNLQKTH